MSEIALEQRLRIIYSVEGPPRYASHLDQMAIWERAARRAGVPLVYSRGFTPRPRLQIAAALPVGFAAGAECIDLWLEEPADPGTVAAALAAALPQGMEVVAVEEVPLDEPSLPTQVFAAEYVVRVETECGAEALQSRIDQLLAAESLPRVRRGKSYDLRPLIEALELKDTRDGEGELWMRLTAKPGATGRPEEVVGALDLGGDFYRVCRARLILEAQPET